MSSEKVSLFVKSRKSESDLIESLWPLYQLPIYPAPPPKVILVEEHNPLTPHVKVVREAVSDVLGDARSVIDSGVDKFVKFERTVERESKLL